LNYPLNPFGRYIILSRSRMMAHDGTWWQNGSINVYNHTLEDVESLNLHGGMLGLGVHIQRITKVYTISLHKKVP
jgi:hypothetical protein